jgi:hypothetical protein
VVEPGEGVVVGSIELLENRIVVVVEPEAANVGQGRDRDNGREERTVEPCGCYRDPPRAHRTGERRGVCRAACDYF